VRFAYTQARSIDPIFRAYLRIHVNGHVVPAIIDTGADGSVLSETDARLAGIPYTIGSPTVGVGGHVRTFRVIEAVTVTLSAPMRKRGRTEWVEIGRHKIEPRLIPSSIPMPALVGRTDLLVHYRFTLLERDLVFELTPLR